MRTNLRDAGARRWLRLATWSLPLLTLGVLGFATHRLQRQAVSPFPVAATLSYSSLTASGADALPGLDELPVPTPRSVPRGETLMRLFERLGLSAPDAYGAALAATQHLDPRHLRAGDRYAAYYGSEGALARVVFDVDDRGRLEVLRSADGWSNDWRPYRSVSRERVVRGVLDGSLEGSLEDAGASALVAYRLADVFQWSLDFNRDLRLGDRFEIVYDEILVNGRPQRVGEIHAAVYENQGRRLEAYRFGEDGAYYDGEGRPLRKQFLRSPLEFSRVTSRFSQRRFHPVLKTYRPHYGVDYGAQTGTPVRVTATGVVVSARWDDGGGRMITVRHPNGYETSYLHLSRYADGVRAGARVSQADVIGYVGSTGLATAPHLDYRVRRNGRYLDPLSLRSEPAPPLSGAALDRFFAVRDELAGKLLPVELTTVGG